MYGVISLIDRFIRPELKFNKDIHLKAQLLVATHFITIVYSLLHLAIFTAIKYYHAVYALSLIASTTLIALFIFRKKASINLAANSIIFWAFIGFLIFIYSSGGIYSPTISWLLPVSLLGFLLANRISGFIWSGLSVFTIVFFYFLNLSHVNFPVLHSPKWLSLHNTVAYTGSSLFVLLIVLIYDAIYRQRKLELEISNKKLSESEASLKDSLEAITIKEQVLKKINKELREKTHELFQQKEEIQTQKEEIECQRDEIFHQKNEIEKKNLNLTDSIQYALRIQEAMLPSTELISANVPNHFILFKPRDIVSGDFYWFRQIKNFTFIAAADCTGHGVPGAFMSMLGISLLNEILTKRDLNPPNEVLDELRKRIKKSLHQKGQDGQTQDGMDIALCMIDNETNELQFSGAFNPLYIIRKNKEGENYDLIEIKADRMPIGVHPNDGKNFTNNVFQLYPKDSIYIFSDGFTSQFGGPEGEKFKTRRFKELLLDIQGKDMITQKQILEKNLTKWQGETEQVDDILLIGLKV